MSKRKKGAIILIISAFCFSVLSIFVRKANRLPVLEIVFFRNIVNAAGAYILLKRSGNKFEINKENYFNLFMRCFCGFVAVYFSFYATTRAAQADVSTITRMAPFITILLAAIFLKEKVSVYQIIAMLLSFGGVFAVVGKPGFNSEALPLLAACACAVLSSMVNIFLKKLGGKVKPAVVVLCFSSFCALGSLPFVLASFVKPTLMECFFLVMVGICAIGGQMTLTSGMAMVPAGEGSLYDLFGIPSSALLGLVFLNESLKSGTIIGALLIIAASVVLFIANKEK